MALKMRTRPREPLAAEPGESAEVTRRRFLRRRRAQRLRVWRRVLLALAGVGAAAGLVWLVFFSPVLAVTGAEVEGTSFLSDAEVVAAARLPMDVPLARADLDAVEARVESLEGVRSADVGRAWPDKVSIEVTERVPVAVVSWEDRWRALDETGVVFRSYEEKPEGLPEVRVQPATPVEALSEAAAVIAALPDDLLQRVEHLQVGSIDAIDLTLRNGAVVHWGSAELSEKKAEVLAVLLERKGREYDVTAPGRPTLRN